MKEKSDQELVKETLKGIDNYKYLVERYEKRLSTYIKRILYLNTEDAEDILQEVFIKAYRNLNSYNPKYKFSNWIYRIAHNESVSFLRKNKNLQKNIVNTEENNIFDSIPSDIDLEKEILEDSEREGVLHILQKLDPKSRDVLQLKYIEEKDYNEISEILQISSGTVGSLISRAKIKLKKLLEDGKNK